MLIQLPRCLCIHVTVGSLWMFCSNRSQHSFLFKAAFNSLNQFLCCRGLPQILTTENTYVYSDVKVTLFMPLMFKLTPTLRDDIFLWWKLFSLTN